MSIKKMIQIMKSGSDYYLTAAGIVGVVIGVVALFVATPVVITAPIVIAAGISFAIYGAYQAKKKIKLDEAMEEELRVERATYKQEHEELLILARSLREQAVKPEEVNLSERADTITEKNERPIVIAVEMKDDKKEKCYYLPESGAANGSTFFVIKKPVLTEKKIKLPMMDTAVGSTERILLRG